MFEVLSIKISSLESTVENLNKFVSSGLGLGEQLPSEM